MRNHKILLFFSICYLLLNNLVLTAQTDLNTRENSYSLLWKIEGDSLKKPSYLFGTMHVRDKKAFAFSDSVLLKLFNVDVFASEFDIDSMNNVAIQKSIVDAENRFLFDDDFSESELKKLSSKSLNNGDKFDYNLFKNKTFKELKEYFDNFETFDDNLMPTYVDAYLFQIAKTTGKHVMGMESVESGYSLLDTLSAASQKKYINSKFDSLPYFLNSKEQMLNLYYEGNVDSIWHFYSNNWYYLKKVLLDNRNLLMVDTMDKIMKNQSVFIAAGVAHLSGDLGLIQLFRNKGYTVTKVNATFTGVADSVMGLFSNGSESWYTHIDTSKSYSIDVPTKPTSYDLFGGIIKMYLCLDILKNNAYYFYSVPSVLSGVEKDEDILKLVKTVFDKKKNIEIVSKKKIYFNGIQGYEIILKSLSVFEAKARIYMANGQIYFQMVGNNEAGYNTDEANRFFESFRITEKIEHSKGIWTNYTYNDGAFSVKFPYEPNYMKKEVPNSKDIYQKPYYFHMYTCINQKDKEVYIIRWNDLPEGYYYDNYKDIYQATFASILGDDYEFHPEKEIQLEAGRLKGFETLKTLKENSFELRTRVYIRGNRIYLLLGQSLIGNKESKVDEFFNSFQGNQYLETTYKTYDIEGIKIQLPAQPIISENSETSGSWYNDIPYKVYASTDPNNGVLYTVTVNMYPKYYFTSNADSLLKNIESETYYLQQISDTKTGRSNQGVYFRSGMATDEDSPNKILFQYFLNGYKSYEVCSYLSEELLLDSLQNKVYGTIAFDTIDTSFDIFNKKTDLIFTDLQSKDSIKFDLAKNALNYHPFDSSDIPLLYKALAFNYPDSVESWGCAKIKIIDAIKENHDENAVRVLTESFYKDHGSKIDFLLAISEIDTLQKNLVFSLLSEIPDSSLISYKLNKAFTYLADSTEFFKEKINELIGINRKSTYASSLVNVINENFDTLKLGQEQISLLSEYFIDLFNLSYDSLLNSDEENYNRYQFIELMTSVLLFFTYDTSNSYDKYLKKAGEIDDKGVLAKVCLYNLSRDNKVSSSDIKTVIEDPENSWDFLVEAGKLNKLSKINKNFLTDENLAQVLLMYSFYWEDEYVPENIDLIETRNIRIKEKEYTYYIFTFSDGEDGPYLSITGGFELIDGRLLVEDVIFNYSYEEFDSESKKEEIISNLISIYE